MYVQVYMYTHNACMHTSIRVHPMYTCIYTCAPNVYTHLYVYTQCIHAQTVKLSKVISFLSDLISRKTTCKRNLPRLHLLVFWSHLGAACPDDRVLDKLVTLSKD